MHVKLLYNLIFITNIVRHICHTFRVRETARIKPPEQLHMLKNYRNNTPAVIEMGNLDEVPSTPLQNISLVRKYMPPGCCAGMMSEAHDVHVEHKFGTYRSRNWSCFTMKIKDAKSKWCDICVCWYCCCMPTACACLCKKDIECGEWELLCRFVLF